MKIVSSESCSDQTRRNRLFSCIIGVCLSVFLSNKQLHVCIVCLSFCSTKGCCVLSVCLSLCQSFARMSRGDELCLCINGYVCVCVCVCVDVWQNSLNTFFFFQVNVNPHARTKILSPEACVLNLGVD